jgi:hypothetical protein
MSKLPIEARWRNSHRQIVRLSIPDRPFTVAVDARGSHLEVTLTRFECEQVAASLRDLLRITEGDDNLE